MLIEQQRNMGESEEWEVLDELLKRKRTEFGGQPTVFDFENPYSFFLNIVTQVMC